MLIRKTIPTKDSLAARVSIAILGLLGHLTAPINNRGFSRVATFVARHIAPRESEVCIQLSEDAQFVADLRDPYWSRLISTGYQYEPELHALFKCLHSVDYLFLDCGANKGYWTILASSRALGSKAVIAVEPMPETFEWLSRNVAANGRDVMAVRKAISSQSGRKMSMYFRGDHAGSTVEHSWAQNANDREEVFEVESRSIDDVLSDAPGSAAQVVIKLDIEGHEIAALKGATLTLDRMPLIIFEEYGGNPAADLTAFVQEDLRYAVFFLEDDGTIVEIAGPADVNKRKKNPYRGYNLCACSRSSVFYAMLARGGSKPAISSSFAGSARIQWTER